MQKFIPFSFLLALFHFSFSCDCPPVGKISKEQFDLYDVIFEGKADSVFKNSAWFSINTLHKGNSTRKIKIFFDDSTDCRMSFAKGEDWIIYSNYIKFGVLAVNFCSRSRKKPETGKADLFAISNESSYDDEELFLKQNLGITPFKKEREKDNFPERELIRPKGWMVIWLLLASLVFFIAFYFLSKRIFKK